MSVTPYIVLRLATAAVVSSALSTQSSALSTQHPAPRRILLPTTPPTSRSPPMPKLLYETAGPIAIVTINRPEVRNAVDSETAGLLFEAFSNFDADDSLAVAILQGTDGAFCAGAGLKAVASGGGNRVRHEGEGPLGCTRMLLSKPV